MGIASALKIQGEWALWLDHSNQAWAMALHLPKIEWQAATRLQRQ